MAKRGGYEIGVYKIKDKYWVASVRLYTPDGPTKTKEILKNFPIADYDEDNGAFQAAVEFRKQFTLMDGMSSDVE